MSEQTVFVVDDDAAVQDSLRILLEQQGYRVMVWSSGDEFLDRVDSELSGVLILDVRLPGKNGIEILETLGQITSRLKVIMITGHADIPMTVRAMKTGAVEFLEKPFFPDSLLKAVGGAFALLAKEESLHVRDNRPIERFSALNPRERVILSGIVRGISNKEMAEQLDVSLRTVQFARAHMFRQIGFRNRTELMEWIVSGNLDLKQFHAEAGGGNSQ